MRSSWTARHISARTRRISIIARPVGRAEQTSRAGWRSVGRDSSVVTGARQRSITRRTNDYRRLRFSAAVHRRVLPLACRQPRCRFSCLCDAIPIRISLHLAESPPPRHLSVTAARYNDFHPGQHCHRLERSINKFSRKLRIDFNEAA